MKQDYRQAPSLCARITEELRRRVLLGILAEGDRLPPVRELAAELAINPSILQRAYQTLEEEGWVCSIPGKGAFVCNSDTAGAVRLAGLLEELDRLAAELEALGYSRAALAQRLADQGGQIHD